MAIAGTVSIHRHRQDLKILLSSFHLQKITSHASPVTYFFIYEILLVPVICCSLIPLNMLAQIQPVWVSSPRSPPPSLRRAKNSFWIDTMLDHEQHKLDLDPSYIVPWDFLGPIPSTFNLDNKITLNILMRAYQAVLVYCLSFF